MTKQYLNKPSKYNKNPFVEVKDEAYKVINGWGAIAVKLNNAIASMDKKKKIVVVETYQGVIHEELINNLKSGLQFDRFINVEELMLPEDRIKQMVFPDVTNDRLFGYLTRLEVDSFFDDKKVTAFREEIDTAANETIIIYGTGAGYVCPSPDLLVYADMTRREIQLRMQQHLVDNIGVKNRNVEDWMLLLKQGYFVDWRVCDRLKRRLLNKWDYVVDTNIQEQPKLISGEAVLEGLKTASQRPFSVVPFFDQGPWGGQWLRNICNLDPEPDNYAWCFNCVPEENSLLLKFGNDFIEIPSINLVFCYPVELLGDPVHGRFGEEFPIRFNFLDTMGGGNLSLQVHPTTGYIQEKFGMHYTQDESYYLMDAEKDAVVYLGLKNEVDRDKMLLELKEAQTGGKAFEAKRHVKTWPVKKHDHVLIPAGTVHSSGRNNMVLEISTTPNYFTFKLWDWGRLGLDGKPRPINIEHGKNVIQWNWTTDWTKSNLIGRVDKIAEGDGWTEERTGLHEREFIETRRHWFTKKTEHDTNGGVNVICLVEGEQVVVESPTSNFEPFVVNYAEVFIVPAAVGKYTINPYGEAIGTKCGTIKAYVRF